MINKIGRTLLLLLLFGLIDHAHRLLLRISRVPRLLLTLCLWAHVLPAAGFRSCTWAATKEQTASTHRQNKLPVQQTRTADLGPSSLTPTWVSRFRRMPLQVCVCDAPKLCSVLINHEDFPASICSIDPAARRPTTWQQVPLLFSSLLQHSPDNRLFLRPCYVIIEDDQHYDGGSIKIVSIRIILNCQVTMTH